MPRLTKNSLMLSKENIADVIETPKSKRGRPKKRKNSEESLGNNNNNKSPKSESPTTSLSNILNDHLNVTTPKSTNKFRSARRALADNSTLKLPGREAQYDELTLFLDELIDSKQSASLYINGPPGKLTIISSSLIRSNFF